MKRLSAAILDRFVTTGFAKGDLPGHDFRGNQYSSGNNAKLPKLPKNPKRLNIDIMVAHLESRGYKFVKINPYDLKTGASYRIKQPNGKEADMTPKEITDILYGEKE